MVQNKSRQRKRLSNTRRRTSSYLKRKSNYKKKRSIYKKRKSNHKRRRSSHKKRNSQIGGTPFRRRHYNSIREAISDKKPWSRLEMGQQAFPQELIDNIMLRNDPQENLRITDPVVRGTLKNPYVFQKSIATLNKDIYSREQNQVEEKYELLPGKYLFCDVARCASDSTISKILKSFNNRSNEFLRSRNLTIEDSKGQKGYVALVNIANMVPMIGMGVLKHKSFKNPFCVGLISENLVKDKVEALQDASNDEESSSCQGLWIESLKPITFYTEYDPVYMDVDRIVFTYTDTQGNKRAGGLRHYSIRDEKVAEEILELERGMLFDKRSDLKQYLKDNPFIYTSKEFDNPNPRTFPI